MIGSRFGSSAKLLPIMRSGRKPGRACRGLTAYDCASAGCAAGVRMCRRVTVPASSVLAWTRSQSWLTSQRPLPPSSSSGGTRCLASGSVIWPVSDTWQMILSLVRQMCNVPPPPV